MKKRFPTFLAGFLSAVVLFSLSVTASATITGITTIEVGPIKIQVNGEEFKPTDANGNPVDVFVYNGTTYAPLRALAEAYGLTVGYDPEKNMATVDKPNSTGNVTPVETVPSTENTTPVETVPSVDNVSLAQQAINLLKNSLKLPSSLTINKVRVYHPSYNGTTNTVVEIDYSAMNSLGGYDRGYYLFKNGDTFGMPAKSSAIDSNGLAYDSVDLSQLTY